MAFEEGLVLTFNSARRFAPDGKRVFTPAANTVVVTAENGESCQWEATDGLYEINNIAVSKDGVICIAGKRLSVSLQFLNTDLRKLRGIESVASVEIKQVDFSVDGSCLFALCNYPSSCVKVFRAGRKGVFTPQCAATPPDVEHSSILRAPFSGSGCDFVAMTAQEARGQMHHGEKYVEFFSTGCEDEQITCGVALENGVIFGTDKDNVCIYQHRGRRQDVLANLGKATTPPYAIGECQALVATADNQLLKIGGDQEGSQALCALPAPAVAIVVAENGKGDILLGTEAGIYKAQMATQNCTLFGVRGRPPPPPPAGEGAVALPCGFHRWQFCPCGRWQG